MSKTIFNILFINLILNSTLSIAQEASQNIKDREHSIRDIIDRVSKPKETEASRVDKAKHIFKDSTISGQVKVLHSGYSKEQDSYATAIGGLIKYKLAEYKGFNAVAEVSMSQDMNFATGDESKQNSELSSLKGSYIELSQAYLNYKNSGFNVRLGRQLIETPLADSNDIRMILNTFEAYIATYESEGLMLTGGLITKYQGIDAGLNSSDHWANTGDNGTYFGGISYSTKFIDTRVWYFDISKDTNLNSVTGNVANSSLYTDISLHTALSKDYSLHANAQYINQSQTSGSDIEASIYGVMAELVMFEDFAITAAYNRSIKRAAKGSFSGFGGGTLYTNMDSMTIDVITLDRNSRAIVTGVSYAIGDFGLLYAYGDFSGDSDSQGVKEHIVEQNLGFSYTLNENLTIAAIYVKNSDRENTHINAGDWENIRALLIYNF